MYVNDILKFVYMCRLSVYLNDMDCPSLPSSLPTPLFRPCPIPFLWAEGLLKLHSDSLLGPLGKATSIPLTPPSPKTLLHLLRDQREQALCPLMEEVSLVICFQHLYSGGSAPHMPTVDLYLPSANSKCSQKCVGLGDKQGHWG